MTNQNIDVTIQQQQYDTRSAQAWAKAGKTEQCVPRYLLAGARENPELAYGVIMVQRWWR